MIVTGVVTAGTLLVSQSWAHALNGCIDRLFESLMSGAPQCGDDKGNNQIIKEEACEYDIHLRIAKAMVTTVTIFVIIRTFTLTMV